MELFNSIQRKEGTMKKLFLFFIIGMCAISISSANEDLGLPVGVQAPDFEAATYDGGQVKLSEITKDGPAVLIFYRGGWCPYCNRQLQELQSRLEEFQSTGATIVAISVDRQEKAAESVEGGGLGFTVVSDPEAGLLELYNIVYHVPDELVKKYKEEYKIDLERDSGETHHIIAVPAAFVVNRSGKIVFAYVNEDYKVRVSTDALLEALKNLDQ